MMTEQDRATAARIVALYEDAGLRSGLLTYQIDMLRSDIAAAIAAARAEGREIERIEFNAAMRAYRMELGAGEWEAVLTDAERARLVELGALTVQV